MPPLSPPKTIAPETENPQRVGKMQSIQFRNKTNRFINLVAYARSPVRTQITITVSIGSVLAMLVH
jgi:hypothetical protein